MTTLGPSQAQKSGHVKPTDRSQERSANGASPQTGFGWSLVRLLCLIALVAVPIFAHGCHGEDVDDELFVRVWTP